MNTEYIFLLTQSEHQFRHGVGQKIAFYASPTAGNSASLTSAFPLHLSSFSGSLSNMKCHVMNRELMNPFTWDCMYCGSPLKTTLKTKHKWCQRVDDSWWGVHLHGKMKWKIQRKWSKKRNGLIRIFTNTVGQQLKLQVPYSRTNWHLNSFSAVWLWNSAPPGTLATVQPFFLPSSADLEAEQSLWARQTARTSALASSYASNIFRK